ncbi:toprim domain-containing protein, partial [Xenorhabdus japonica]
RHIDGFILVICLLLLFSALMPSFSCIVVAMNAGHMAKFIAPRGVNHLIIFADNDWNATGEAAAYACANKNLLANNDIEKVSVRYPDLGDFNDLLQQGCQARERVFPKKQQETA